MGIRFRCHHCETELNVKDFQAGKRGRCPDCRGKFRIPASDAPHSLPPDASIESESDALGAESSESTQAVAATGAVSNPSPDVGQQEPAPQVTEPAATPTPPQPRVQQPSIQQPALPRALQAVVEGKWYVRPPSGGQFGPAPSSVVWQWLGENRVGRDALVWCEGWPEWLIAEKVFDDYFSSVEHDSAGVAVPQRTAADATATTNATTNPSLSDRNRAGRKQKRRRNYTMMIAVLTVVTLLLVGALVVVLMRQPA